MSILGIFYWEFINIYIKKEKILKTNGLKCDGYGFVTGLEDVGLHKDQGDDVLDALWYDSPTPKP